MATFHVIESKHDSDLAKKLVEELQRLDHTVTWDLNYLVPGVEWRQSLKDAVINCDGLIALFTEHSVTDTNVVSSQWMASDIGTARAYGKFIIPLIIGKETRIPELINDTFCIIEQDSARIREVAKKIDEATRTHIDKKAKELNLNLPVGYQHLASHVLRFQEKIPYDKSVFVMMKFPDRINMDETSLNLLTDIWDEIVQTLSTYGLFARRADKGEYHDQLWENICVNILGCRYGIAILEDRAAAELNPNVTLEYGFMKALNRNVVLFRDINFKHDRADLTGKLAKSFEIDTNRKLDKPSLTKAIQDWLLDMGIAPVLRR